MQILRDIQQLSVPEWQELMSTSSTANWFQSVEAYRFYQSVPEQLEAFVYAVHDGCLKGMVVGYVTKEQSRIKQYFTRRAIIVGGPLLADDICDEQLAALLNAVKHGLKNKAIYIESRNFNSYARWREVFVACGFAYKAHLNFHIDTTDRDAMWERITKSKRRQIRSALAQGVTIEPARNTDDVKAFYRLLQQLYKKKVRRPLFGEPFFLRFFENRVGEYLLVKYDGAVIGGVMAPMTNRCIYEWYICGNEVQYKELYPNVVATWAIMDYAVAHGIGCFDVMGAGMPDVPYGVREFKADFGGELVEHGRFEYISKPLLHAIGTLGIKILGQFK